jgi:hypothetical protein
MNVTRCDRIAYYVASDGQHVTLPIVAGTTPADSVERHGRQYVRLMTATPTGEDAGLVLDRAILAAVRAAEEAGETEDLIREALEELEQVEDAA